MVLDCSIEQEAPFYYFIGTRVYDIIKRWNDAI